MQARKQSPTYRIQTVAVMTGVPAATLRSWERRYGVPQPVRTRTAYRLYNDDEVALIRRMKALIDEGLVASEAAARVLAVAPAAPLVADVFARAADSLVEAALAYDAARLTEQLRWALTLGDANAVFGRVLTPALVRLGELWQAGEASVGQEHFLSEAVEHTARDLLRLVQPPASAPAVLLACFPDEQHHLALYGVGIRLASLGVRSLLLGPRTPVAALAEAAARVRPVMIGLSLTITPPLERGRELLREIATAAGAVPWAVGGVGAGPLAESIEELGGAVIHPWPDGVDALVRTVLRRHAGGS